MYLLVNALGKKYSERKMTKTKEIKNVPAKE